MSPIQLSRRKRDRMQLQSPATNKAYKKNLNICTFNNNSKRKIQFKLASYYEKGSDSSRLYSHYIFGLPSKFSS